jgi:integrase
MAIEKFITASGKISYRVSIWDKGARTKHASFTKEADAKQWEQTQYVVLEREKSFPERPKEMTFEELYNQWMTEYAEIHKAHGSLVRDRQLFRIYIKESLGNKKTKDIRPEDIEIIKINLIKEDRITKTSINRVLELIRTVLNFAVRRLYIAYSPMKAVRMLPIEEQPFDYWNSEEASKFLSFCNEKYSGKKRWPYVFYLILLKTGIRLGEALGLTWDSVIFDKNLICISATYDKSMKQIKKTTKSKKIRHVGIDDEIKFELLKIKQESCSEYLFTNKEGGNQKHDTIRKRYYDVDTLASGVRRIKIHDLRHTFASHFIMNGEDIFTLQRILGHSDSKMTMRYAHLAPDYLAEKATVVKFNSNLNKPKENLIHMSAGFSRKK